MGPRFKVSSERQVLRGIELTTPGLLVRHVTARPRPPVPTSLNNANVICQMGRAMRHGKNDIQTYADSGARDLPTHRAVLSEMCAVS